VKKYLFYLFISVGSLGFAQKNSDITTRIDTAQIRIGEHFQYRITVKKQPNVIFPDLNKLINLELISESKTDTIQDRLIKKYVLTGFDSGHFYIPKQEVFIQNKICFTDSLLIQVATIAVDTIKQKLYPIKPIVEEPYVFDDFKPYLWWALFIILVIVLIIYFFLRKKSSDQTAQKKQTIPAYNDAIEKLIRLDDKQLWQKNKIKTFYIELTEIVRTYIGREIEIPTLEMTTDEIILLVNRQNELKKLGIPKNHLLELASFLKQADFVKFAKLKPLANEIENDRKTASSIIETLNSLIDQYKKNHFIKQEIKE